MQESRVSSVDFIIDQIRDNYEIAQLKKMASATGAIYVGGGVPKNYIQHMLRHFTPTT